MLLLLFALIPFAVDADIVPVSIYGDTEKYIPGKYLVQFYPNAQDAFDAFKSKKMFHAKSFQIADFMGFSAELSDMDLELVQNMDGVMLIERDMVCEASGEQFNPTWGLDRVDQHDQPLDSIYRWNDFADGTGTIGFVIDTGIDTHHPQFEGRAHFAADCYLSTPCDTRNDPGDPQGHGTHCAGTVGSAKWGVAKNASIHSIRVLGPSGGGATGGIIAGVEFAANSPLPNKVISMSLGGGFNQISNNAVNAAFDAGVIVVTASGNCARDACSVSPGSAEKSFNVAASDIYDRIASFSNFGTCVQIYAPGVDIDSAKPGGGTTTMSGTSMACPHVAGLAAIVLSRSNEVTNEAAIDLILQAATQGKIIRNPRGTPNLLMYSL